MKTNNKKFCIIIAFFVFFQIIIPSGCPSSASTNSIMPGACVNVVINFEDSGTRIKNSFLVATNDGYMRVYHDEENNSPKVFIEYYDDELNITNKKSIDMDLPLWGGFYSGNDAYYIVVGQYNLDEDDSLEVIRIIKYSKTWERLGEARITNRDSHTPVSRPFLGGTMSMTEYGNSLYIATGHCGYKMSDGLDHQGLLMIKIDKQSMDYETFYKDYKHSYSQHLINENSKIYLLEKYDGAHVASLYYMDATSKDFFVTDFPLLYYFASDTDHAHIALPSDANLKGIAVSSDNVLCIGVADEPTNNPYAIFPCNLFVTVTSKKEFSENNTAINWLTDYTEEGTVIYSPSITKINDNKFMVLWTTDRAQIPSDPNDTLTSGTMHYVFIDGSGRKISEEMTANAIPSDCQPILKGSNIVFYSSTYNMVDFYIINSQTGAFSKKMYRVLGEYSTWEVKDGVLTLSGGGTIDSGFNSTISDNTYRVVVEKGFDSIPERCFMFMNNINSIEIGEGVKKIGTKAFYYCEGLRDVTLPYSVTEIGDDILWLGSANGYWRPADEIPTIHAYEGSYAAQYAREHGIKLELITAPITDAIVSSGIYCAQTNPSIVAGLVISNKDFIGETIEYRWLACNESNGLWFEVSPWTDNNEWMNYAHDNTGNYIFICYARIKGKPDTEISASFGTPYTAPEVLTKKMSGATIANIPNVTYTGNAVKPFVSVKYGNAILKEGTDYNLKFSNNTKVGTASVKINGMGMYTGSVTKTFKIVKDDTSNADVSYRTYVQSYGWQPYVKDGSVSGTYAQSKRLEGLQIKLSKKDTAGSITYRTYVQKLGWQGWVSNGTYSGTKGKSLRLESFQAKLTGNMSQKYDLYYRVQAQKFGWMGWAKNGASAGTAGYGYRLEAVQIKLVPKNGKAPGKTDNAFVKKQ